MKVLSHRNRITLTRRILGIALAVSSVLAPAHAQTNLRMPVDEGAVPSRELPIQRGVLPRVPVPPPSQRGVPPPPAVVTITCPANASEGGLSTRYAGWSFGSAWAPYLGMEVANPASMGAGANVRCLYGFAPTSRSYPAHLLTMNRNLGAGTRAAMCSVNGDSVHCQGREPVVCPPPQADGGPSRVGAGWSFGTAWPGRLLRVRVIDPPSMNAGALVECAYGPDTPQSRPDVVLTLSHSTGAGIDAGMCRMSPAQATVTCNRP